MTINASFPIQIRWADIDQNHHLRHSAYYDFGAIARIQFLSNCGLTSSKFTELKTGPILFREEAIFKREIHFEDKITINAALTKARTDFSRWSIQHSIIKNEEILAAVINVDGAWIDTEIRKLVVPGEFVREAFSKFPKAPQFEELD